MTIAPQTVLADHSVLAEPPHAPDPCGPDGVLLVDAVRWATAQRYEATCWLEKYRTAHDDREREHAQRFDNYRMLAGRSFRHAIELGCGPFTQTRRMLRGSMECNSLTLVDPLIDRYAELPHCTYDWLSRGRKLTRIASPLEELAIPAAGYDLVVSINVLEHCRDYAMCVDNIRSLAAKGATMVISEPAVRRADIAEACAKVWDAGHPLRVADDRLQRDLEAMGNVVYKRVLDGLYGTPWRRDFYYILEAK